MMVYHLFQLLTVPLEYDFEVNVLPWASLILSIGFLFTHIYLRKLRKQNKELNQQTKEQEAELASLRQQKSGPGEETE